jgi:hypothetical protein
MESKTHHNGIPAVAFTRNMIEEIEKRSTYLSAVSLVPNISYYYLSYNFFTSVKFLGPDWINSL